MNYSELKNYFCKEISFKINDENESLIDYSSQASRVWLLFGRNSSKKWECLQVGQSKNEVNEEISSLHDYLKIRGREIYKTINSAFYENVCPEGNGELYRKRLYSMIGQKYYQFKICFLDVDKYLGIQKNR